MTSTFSFPVLPRKDIVDILSESEVASIREEDLVHPTSDLVFSIYTKLLIYLDPDQEDHGQADFNALGQLENPDFHVDSIRIMNLCQKIKEVAALVSCPIDFTLRDLIRPDTHRTGVFLSALLNFCLHRETKLALLQPYVNEVNSHEDPRKEYEDKISMLKKELSNLKAAGDREQPFIQELEHQVKELQQTIQGLNNHQMSLKASFRTLREKSSEIDEKISSADFALVQSAQENAKLRSKIVQSPDKLQGALEEKKSVRAEVKNSERSAMQSCQEKTAIFEVHSKLDDEHMSLVTSADPPMPSTTTIHKGSTIRGRNDHWTRKRGALKKMTKHFAQIQAIQEKVNSAKTIDKDVKVIKAKLSDEGFLDKTLEAKLVERQGKVEQLKEMRKALEKEKATKHEEDNKELDRVKMEFESRKHGLAAKEKKVEAMVSEADSISMKINSVKESGAITQQQLRHKNEEIVNEFHRYSQSIGTSMQRVEADLVGSRNDFCSGSASQLISQHQMSDAIHEQ